MIYTVLLNPAIDHILTLHEFQAGDTYKSIKSEKIPLGKALSVACAVSALGEKVKVIGLMGYQDLPLYQAFTKHQNLTCDWVLLKKPVRHNITILEKKNGQTTHIREPGFYASRQAVALVKNKLKACVEEGDWVAFCGSLPPGSGIKTYREMITLCHQKKAHTLLDTSGSGLIEGLRGKPACIKPNQTEFEEIFGEEIKGIQHLALKAKNLVDRGIENVFVSLGEDGVFAANKENAFRAKIKTGRPVNTVGCGDAMVAGIITGLSRKLSFEDACCLGVACGTANTKVTVPGAIRKKEVNRMLSKVEKIYL